MKRQPWEIVLVQAVHEKGTEMWNQKFMPQFPHIPASFFLSLAIVHFIQKLPQNNDLEQYFEKNHVMLGFI